MFMYLIVFIVALFVSFAMAPKSTQPAPASLSDFQVTTAEPGRAIPVVFGTRLVSDPNNVWYGDLSYSAVKTESGK